MKELRHILLCTAACSSLGAVPCSSVSAAQNTALVALQADELSTGEHGHAITAGGVIRLQNGSVLAATFQAQQFADARLYAGTSESVFALDPQTSLLGGFNLGQVDTHNRDYWYQGIKLGVQHQLDAGYSVHVADQYFDSDKTYGQLLTAGLSRIMARWQATAELSGTLSGNIDNRYALLRIDHVAALRLYGGVIAGQTRNIVGELRISTSAQSYHQLFAGACWSQGSQVYSFDWNTVYTGAVRHHTLSLTTKWLLPP